MQWSDVKTLVKANLGRQSDTNVDTLMPIWADVFQRRVQRDRKYWFLKTTSSRDIDQTAQSYPLPSDFREGMVFYLSELKPTFNQQAFVELDHVSDLDVLRLFGPVKNASGEVQTQFLAQPTCVNIADHTVTFWPWPDKTYTAKCIYWRDASPPVAASPDAFTNIWISDYPDLYEQELTAAGFRYLGDIEKAMLWETRAMKTLGDVRAANVTRELAGPGKLALIPVKGVFAPTQLARINTWRVYS